MIFEILFWLAVLLMVHSYLLYPVLLKILSARRKENSVIYQPHDELPFVSVIMSVHNEEMVIADKVRSLYYTLYPPDKFEVIIGSDHSTDGTNTICQAYTENYPNFRFYPFSSRQGKPAVINKLTEAARGEIVIMTDAKVFFGITTIPELIKHFKNPGIHMVGGNIINEKTNPVGISIQEKAFMNREIRMKYREGLIWRKTMGVYGAVYAIRKESISPVPPGFSVDDFYISMKVLSKGHSVIMNLNALTTENVPDDLKTEFRRKVRISAGNFQNLRYFRACLWPPYKTLPFIFISHKVIRWLGPHLLIMILLLNLILAGNSGFYRTLFALQLMLFIIPFIDLLLRKINIHIIILRFVTHFFAMNIALLSGFLKSLSGKKTDIWQPTRR